jgi:acyl carrier protein
MSKVEQMPDFVFLQAGSLDDPSLYRPTRDVFTESAQAWDHMSPVTKKLPTCDPADAPSALVAVEALTSAQLELELRRLIAQQLGVSDTALRDDMALADIGLDSIQIAEVVIGIERRATKPIDISDLTDQIDADTSLGGLLRLVEQRLSDQGVLVGPASDEELRIAGVSRWETDS